MFIKCPDCGAPQSISDDEKCLFCGNIFQQNNKNIDLKEIKHIDNSELLNRSSFKDAVINFNNKKYKTALIDFQILSANFPEEIILTKYKSECEYNIGEYKNINQYFFFQTQIEKNETHLIEIIELIDGLAYSSGKYMNIMDECLFMLLEYNDSLFFNYLNNKIVPNSSKYHIVIHLTSIIKNYSNHEANLNLEKLFDWYIDNKIDLNNYWSGGKGSFTPYSPLVKKSISNILKVVNKSNSKNSLIFLEDYIDCLMGDSGNILKIISTIKIESKSIFNNLGEEVKNKFNSKIYKKLINIFPKNDLIKRLNIDEGFDFFSINGNQHKDIIDGIHNLSMDNLKKSNSSSTSCFIATATMGDYNHPIVLELRNFRDNWLSKRNWGIKFINWYYKNSPKAARVIEKNHYLKKISFQLLIKPLHFLVKRIK